MQSLLCIGFFPWVCAVSWLIFIPGFFWDFLTGTMDHGLPILSPVKSTRRLDWSMAGLVLFSVIDIVAWNAASLRGSDAEQWMKTHDLSKNIIHVNQRWKMYAPYPYNEHGWLLFPAELADGTRIDAFTGKPISWAKPPNIVLYFGDDRWRTYFDAIMYNSDPQIDRQYSDYLAIKWNKNHPENQKIKTLAIIFMKEATQPNLTISVPERVTLYSENF